MKALTILQPYAALIAAPPHVKRVENRPWRTHYRGELAIHAGKSRRLVRDWEGGAAGLHYQAIVAVVEVLDCVPLAEVSDDPYASGPWCWRLGHVRPLSAPVPCAGALSLWQVPADVEALVRAQLAG